MKKVIYPIATVLLIILMWLLSSHNQIKTTITYIAKDEKSCKDFILEKSNQGYRLIDFEPAIVPNCSEYVCPSHFIIVMEK